MKTRMILTLLLAVAIQAGAAQAVQLFDFDAQAKVPAAVGQSAEIYGVIVNGSAVDSPLPLDYDNYQFTIVVTGLVRDTDAATSLFSGGTVTIYQDDATAADWSAPATFTDGAIILSGAMDSFQHVMLTSTLGNGVGSVDWTGGAMLDSLAPGDQSDWPFLTLISRSATQVQAGYDERWDGKVEPQEDVVSTEERSWSELKVLFR
jgi:hypothetical protein